jgi:hypothetical protein
MGKKSESGSGFNNPDHIFESLKKQFFGLKSLNSWMWIQDPGWKKFGSGIRYPVSGMEKRRIRHPG